MMLVAGLIRSLHVVQVAANAVAGRGELMSQTITTTSVAHVRRGLAETSAYTNRICPNPAAT